MNQFSLPDFFCGIVARGIICHVVLLCILERSRGRRPPVLAAHKCCGAPRAAKRPPTNALESSVNPITSSSMSACRWSYSCSTTRNAATKNWLRDAIVLPVAPDGEVAPLRGVENTGSDASSDVSEDHVDVDKASIKSAIAGSTAATPASLPRRGDMRRFSGVRLFSLSGVGESSRAGLGSRACNLARDGLRLPASLGLSERRSSWIRFRWICSSFSTSTRIWPRSGDAECGDDM